MSLIEFLNMVLVVEFKKSASSVQISILYDNRTVTESKSNHINTLIYILLYTEIHLNLPRLEFLKSLFYLTLYPVISHSSFLLHHFLKSLFCYFDNEYLVPLNISNSTHNLYISLEHVHKSLKIVYFGSFEEANEEKGLQKV